MEALTLSIHWHDNNQPIYSVHVQPKAHKSSARLATGGGDNNVRMWELVYGEDKTVRSVRYLSTLTKHTQAVNVVRFDPKGELLATAGDDGTVLIWRMASSIVRDFGADPDDEMQESWIVQHACRSSTSEIYDLAWSPDSRYILAGSMDNVTRIYHAKTGKCVRELAEHSHYVQGVCWDPRNEYLATQSADRSVHVYALKHGAEGAPGADVDIAPTIFYKISKADLPKSLYHYSGTPPVSSASSASPGLSTPKSKKVISTTQTPSPTAPATSMHPPSSLRRLSAGPQPRSLSPGPSVALPAVRPIDGSHVRSALYHNETLLSFFRRLTFSIDGSILLTPSGVFKTAVDSKEESTNTVYVYTRAGINCPPVYHLPGLKKPAVAIAFSPVKYQLRRGNAIQVSPIGVRKGMPAEPEHTTVESKGPLRSVLALPYRMMFAVATQDSVVVYDTQQQQPLGQVSNLHYSAFTDVAWSSDGRTLIISSTDGFCSIIALKNQLLGLVYEEVVGGTSDIDVSRTPSEINEISTAPLHETVKTFETPKEMQASLVTGETALDNIQEGSAPKKRRIAPTVVEKS